MLGKMCFIVWMLNFWNLSYDKPELFTRCYWQKKERVLLVWLAYRLVIFLYFIATTLYTILDPEIPPENQRKYMIFLTNWTYVLQLIHFGLAFYITAIRFVLERREPDIAPLERNPIIYKVYWVLFSITLPVSVAICILFWSFIYDSSLYPVNIRSLILHCFNGLVSIVDFILVPFPLKLSFFFYNNTYIVIYAIFTVIYYFCGGTGTNGMKPIYKNLDWGKPYTAFFLCLTALFVTDTCHFFFWFFSFLKEYRRREILRR